MRRTLKGQTQRDQLGWHVLPGHQGMSPNQSWQGSCPGSRACEGLALASPSQSSHPLCEPHVCTQGHGDPARLGFVRGDGVESAPQATPCRAHTLTAVSSPPLRCVLGVAFVGCVSPERPAAGLVTESLLTDPH